MQAHESHLKQLLMRGLGGDNRAYETFLTDLAKVLPTFAKRQLRRLDRGEADAEDIVQETLIAIHGKRHTYDPDVPVTAWAHAIARYKLIDLLRLHSRADLVPLEEINEMSFSGRDIDTRTTAQKLLALLPVKLRTALELTKLEGLSVAEAAARSGTSQEAVRVNVHRGLKALARLQT